MSTQVLQASRRAEQSRAGVPRRGIQGGGFVEVPGLGHFERLCRAYYHLSVASIQCNICSEPLRQSTDRNSGGTERLRDEGSVLF